MPEEQTVQAAHGPISLPGKSRTCPAHSRYRGDAPQKDTVMRMSSGAEVLVLPDIKLPAMDSIFNSAAAFG